jgi:hypothetical protein
MSKWVEFRHSNTNAASQLRGHMLHVGAMRVVVADSLSTRVQLGNKHAVGPWLQKIASDHHAKLLRDITPPDNLVKLRCGLYALTRSTASRHEMQCKRCESPGVAAAAREFLQRELADGPVKVSEIMSAGSDAGIRNHALRTARADLGARAITRRTVVQGRGGSIAHWEWSLPAAEQSQGTSQGRKKYAGEEINAAAATGNAANAAAPVVAVAPAAKKVAPAAAMMATPASLIKRFEAVERTGYALIDEAEAGLKAIKEIDELETRVQALKVELANLGADRARLLKSIT